MEKIEYAEYRTVDKSEWGYGCWQNEPDKVVWMDESTKLPCLIVRGPSGALCGYVGVYVDHPFFGKSYSDRMPIPKNFNISEFDGRTQYVELVRTKAMGEEYSLGSGIEVHGGITYADANIIDLTDHWEKHRNDTHQFTTGDCAQYLRIWEKTFDDFEAYVEKLTSSCISYIPNRGVPPAIWWFGFDCSHYGDASPKYQSVIGGVIFNGNYRDIEYVKREVTNLAKQLKDLNEIYKKPS